ncbi:MAG: biotin synthase BioB [Parachlamydiales bacterium]
MKEEIRHNWTKDEIRTIHDSPLMELILKAGTVKSQYHDTNEVQLCHLISVKTGGCPEDCKYCPQSASSQTFVKAEPLVELKRVMDDAQSALEYGVTRICMGAAWRSVRDSPQFDRVLEMVKEVSSLGVEVCTCLGMLNEGQAKRLAEAGLYAYNHNVDTSPEYYSQIITTRTFQDRLDTLDTVEKAGISVCCGGIIGMGESIEDRVSMLHVLATREKHPESVPINMLISVSGTPLQSRPPVPIWDVVRMIATTRIIMPQTMVRLSAGREGRSEAEQALCFLAGANSIFIGDKLLTTPNPDLNFDMQMMETLNLTARPAYKEVSACSCS